MKIMGLVRLAPGRAAFYDELTNIHLTISRPEERVVSGMNTANLKRAVAYNEIKLIAGTLDNIQTAPAAEPVAAPAVSVAPVEAAVIEEPKVEEPAVVDEPKAEEPAAVVEEAKAEQPAPVVKAEAKVADKAPRKKPAAPRRTTTKTKK